MTSPCSRELRYSSYHRREFGSPNCDRTNRELFVSERPTAALGTQLPNSNHADFGSEADVPTSHARALPVACNSTRARRMAAFFVFVHIMIDGSQGSCTFR